MKPVGTNVIAGLLGMTLGWVVIADPLSAMFAPTPVTWDASSCPAGAYTITSLARNTSTGLFFVASSPNVALPKDSVVQEFPNLPPGTYAVTATARRSDGKAFGSMSQTVTGLGQPTPVTGANPTVSGRGRSSAAAVISRAVPRRTGGSAPTPGNPRVGAPPITTQGGASAKRTAASAKQAAPAAKLSTQASPLFQMTFDDAGHLVATDGDWRRVELTDLDADGRFDVATIELTNGDIWIVHIKR